MNKAELVAAVAEKSGLSKKDSDKAVSAVLDVIAEELAKGGKVQLVGHRPQPQNQAGDRDPREPRPCLQGRQGSEGRRRQVQVIYPRYERPPLRFGKAVVFFKAAVPSPPQCAHW